MEKYAVIMAGGGGTRFWPLSRQNMPKQLLNLSGNDVMINETIKRIKDVIKLENIIIVTGRNQKELIREVILSGLPDENLLCEPVGRNTAPCIAYAALAIEARCRDAVMCVLPSDHFIADEEKFRQVLGRAFDAAEETDKLITIGIKPGFPSTSYGYIRINPQETGKSEDIFETREFVEKPNIEKAVEYLKDGSYFWNSGMFAWKVSTILANFKRYLPRLYGRMAGLKEHIAAGTDQDVIDAVYSELQSISIDFGILERSDDVLVIPGDFGWSDAGSWDVLGAIFPTDENGNIVRARHVGINTKDSIIFSNDRLISTINIEGFIIADSGDALLICPKTKAQDVRKIVEILKERDLKDFI